MNNPKPVNRNVIPIKSSTPPSSRELELAVIGGVLFDPYAIARVAATLRPEHFYYSAHQEIYRAAIDLHQHQQPVDLMMVATWLRDRGLLEKVGGQSALIQAIDSVVSAVNIDQYAELLIRKWNRREILRVTREIASATIDESLSDEEVLDKAEALLAVIFSSTQQQKAMKPVGDFIQEEVLRVVDLMDGGEKTGIPTGFYDLDALMLGLRPGKLGIIAGRPGMGKSAFLGALAKNVAKQGKKVVIFSLEMSGGEIAQRLIASCTSVNSAKFKIGNLSRDEMAAVCNMAANSLDGIWIDDSSNISVSHIRSRVRELQMQQGVDVVMVDYLHLMLDGTDEDIREIGKITRALKNLSRELGINIQLLSQLSRAVESRSDKRPIMSDLRASGNIEQDADQILFLYRHEYYDPDTSDRGIAELILAKNRDGATGTVKLLFEPQYSRFLNLAR